MAEKSTMSEQAFSDGGVALEKKMNQEDQEQSHRGVLEEKTKKQEHEEEESHRVVVGDGGRKKKQEQEGEESHRVVVGDNGGKKKKQEEAPQQNTTRPLSAAAAIPYKIRVIKAIMTYTSIAHLGMTWNMVCIAIFGNRGISGYVYLSMAFFLISTISADRSLQFSHRRNTALVISATTWILGWGFLAAVLDYGDLARQFSGSIIALLPVLILLALYDQI